MKSKVQGPLDEGGGWGQAVGLAAELDALPHEQEVNEVAGGPLLQHRHPQHLAP